MADSMVVVGRRNFILSVFLSELKRRHKGSFIGGNFERLVHHFEAYSDKGDKIRGTITKITDN